jgi:hypothetical protein
MAIRPAQPFSSYLDGREARQAEDYRGSRNALAALEVEQAPRDIANRNALADRQKEQYSQQQIEKALQDTAAAALRISQSSNPRAELKVNGDFEANLLKQHPEIAQMDDASLKQYLGWVAGQAQSQLGIAPTPKLETIGDTSNPAAGVFQKNPATGALTQVVAPQKPNAMTPYETARLKLEQDKLNAKGSGQPKPPAGYRWSADGSSLEKIAGGPADKASQPPKLTEGDKRARVLYASVLNAEKDIQGATGLDTSSGTQRALGSNALTRGMQSDEYRKYEAAGLRWAANMLYLKSGATAPVEEVESTWKQFFPQFGDGEEVKQQKAAARLQEINAVADAFGLDKSQIPKPAAAKQAGGGPVKVSSPAEAMKLPPGTVFITPDGRRKVR